MAAILNTRQAANKLMRMSANVNKFMSKELKETTDKAYDVAKGLAPQYSGDLKEAISKEVYFVKDGGEGVITSSTPSTGKQPRPYHAWMHGIGQYNTSAHITSGVPNYMDVTAELMIERLAKIGSKLITELEK